MCSSNCFEIFGIVLNLLEPFGIFWNPFGILWNPLKSFGILWNLLNSFGIFCIPLESFVVIQNPLVGLSFQQLESFGWSCTLAVRILSKSLGILCVPENYFAVLGVFCVLQVLRVYQAFFYYDCCCHVVKYVFPENFDSLSAF